MAGDILGLASMFQNAGQGLSGGIQSLTDALGQRRKYQQQQQQFGLDQQKANDERDFQRGSLANTAAGQAETKREFDTQAPKRAADVAETTGRTANAAAEEGRKAKDFSKKEEDDAIAEHVGANVSQNEQDPTNDRDIVVSAMQKNPDVDLNKVRAEIKKQRQQIKESGLSDAQKKAQTNLANAGAAKDYAEAANVGNKANNAAADASAAHDTMLQRLHSIRDRANAGADSPGGGVDFSVNKAAESSLAPDFMRSEDRQAIDADLGLVKTAMPLVTAESKRVPGGPEMKLLNSGVMPTLNSTNSRKVFTQRIDDLIREVEDSKGFIQRAHGVKGAQPAPSAGVATKILGPSPNAPVVGNVEGGTTRPNPFAKKKQ